MSNKEGTSDTTDNDGRILGEEIMKDFTPINFKTEMKYNFLENTINIKVFNNNNNQKKTSNLKAIEEINSVVKNLFVKEILGPDDFYH